MGYTNTIPGILVLSEKHKWQKEMGKGVSGFARDEFNAFPSPGGQVSSVFFAADADKGTPCRLVNGCPAADVSVLQPAYCPLTSLPAPFIVRDLSSNRSLATVRKVAIVFSGGGRGSGQRPGCF